MDSKRYIGGGLPVVVSNEEAALAWSRVLPRLAERPSPAGLDDPCLVFTGPLYLGYGRINVTTADGRRRPMQNHRVAWQVHYGEPPPPATSDHVIHHLCENRACCQVTHLAVVTHRENTVLLTDRGTAAMNARKTHCPRGHLLTTTPRGVRECRMCKTDRQRQRRANRTPEQIAADREKERQRAVYRRLHNERYRENQRVKARERYRTKQRNKRWLRVLIVVLENPTTTDWWPRR